MMSESMRRRRTDAQFDAHVLRRRTGIVRFPSQHNRAKFTRLRPFFPLCLQENWTGRDSDSPRPNLPSSLPACSSAPSHPFASFDLLPPLPPSHPPSPGRRAQFQQHRRGRRRLRLHEPGAPHGPAASLLLVRTPPRVRAHAAQARHAVRLNGAPPYKLHRPFGPPAPLADRNGGGRHFRGARSIVLLVRRAVAQNAYAAT